MALGAVKVLDPAAHCPPKAMGLATEQRPRKPTLGKQCSEPIPALLTGADFTPPVTQPLAGEAGMLLRSESHA
ncbi:hypothetical protein D3C75_544880 [compost metagenome]